MTETGTLHESPDAERPRNFSDRFAEALGADVDELDLEALDDRYQVLAMGVDRVGPDARIEVIGHLAATLSRLASISAAEAIRLSKEGAQVEALKLQLRHSRYVEDRQSLVATRP